MRPAAPSGESTQSGKPINRAPARIGRRTKRIENMCARLIRTRASDQLQNINVAEDCHSARLLIGSSERLAPSPGTQYRALGYTRLTINTTSSGPQSICRPQPTRPCCRGPGQKFAVESSVSQMSRTAHAPCPVSSPSSFPLLYLLLSSRTRTCLHLKRGLHLLASPAECMLACAGGACVGSIG